MHHFKPLRLDASRPYRRQQISKSKIERAPQGPQLPFQHPIQCQVRNNAFRRSISGPPVALTCCCSDSAGRGNTDQVTRIRRGKRQLFTPPATAGARPAAAARPRALEREVLDSDACDAPSHRAYPVCRVRPCSGDSWGRLRHGHRHRSRAPPGGGSSFRAPAPAPARRLGSLPSPHPRRG